MPNLSKKPVYSTLRLQYQLAKAIQTKREDNPSYFEVINCTLNGLDTPEGKDKLEKLKVDAIKAHPLQEVNFICLVGFSDE